MSVTDREAIGPASTVESQPFWEGLRAHRLMLQRCADCKKPRHYPRPMCDRCFSLRDEWFHASGHGQVHSWTVCHHAFHPGFADRVPYVLVTAQMAHGVRMVAPLDENDGSVLSLGAPVTLDYEDVTDGLTLPRFRLADTTDTTQGPGPKEHG